MRKINRFLIFNFSLLFLCHHFKIFIFIIYYFLHFFFISKFIIFADFFIFFFFLYIRPSIISFISQRNSCFFNFLFYKFDKLLPNFLREFRKKYSYAFFIN